MELETRDKAAGRIPKNIVPISALAFILLILAIGAQITYTVLKSDKVYSGVLIDQHNAGGLTRPELTDLLDKNYRSKVDTEELSVKAKDVVEKIKFSEAKVNYDISSAVDKAFEVGRSGNIFDRLSDIIKTSTNSIKLTVPYTFDKERMQKVVTAIYDKTFTEVKELDIKINNDNVVLLSGHHGESIEKDKLFAQIEALISSCNGGNIEVPVVTTPPKKVDIEELYKRISLEAADARADVKDNSVTILPHVVGRSIDKSSLASIVEEVEKSEDAQKVLPVEFIKPKVTTEMARANIFKDTLGTMSTQFHTGNQNDSNRGVNIRLAVSKINGTVLAPGQVFSFNTVVGERSEAGGYKAAHAYISGKIVDDIGGGICQVSTTLYNAILFSDLNVTERTNHMFTVGYVPYGRDAAVSYPGVDFKFRNSTNWPVKLEGFVTKGNQLVFSLKGTNETPGKTITITPQTIKTIEPPPIQYIDDPNLPAGTEKVENEAMKGYVIDTFKITKQDGKVVKEEKLHRSTYKALAKTIRKGIKKVPGAPVIPEVSSPQAGVGELEIPPAIPAVP